MSTTLDISSDAVREADVSPPAPAPPPGRRGRHAHLWLLLALTIVGGVVRFATLTHPTLWGDEAMTFSRVTGDYRDLLDILQSDGFAPLHYELYWVQGKWFGFSPRAMRFIPALAGTLMIPALYFLASQIVGRRAGLLTAAFGCGSAYLMVYSHDAKMYMHFWLMCVLHIACLLWWLRTRLRLAWLAWVAAGLAMVGLHSAGLVIVGVEVLIALTYGWKRRTGLLPVSGAPKHGQEARATRFFNSFAGWRAPILFVIGLLIVVSGPLGYYGGFNRWNQRIAEYGWGRASGLSWIPAQNRGRDGLDMVRYVTSAYLISWEWPQASAEPEINPQALAGLKAAVVLLLGLCFLGLFPWRAGSKQSFSTGGNGGAHQNPPQPWWRALFWVTAWFILPMYGFYLVSVKNGDGPGEWATTIGNLFQQHWWIFLAEIVVVALLCLRWRGVSRWLAWAGPIFVLISFNFFWLQSGLNRPADAVGAWVDWITSAAILPGLLLAALVVWPAVAWYYCAPTVRQRLGKLAVVAGVVAVIVGLCYVLHQALLAWGRDTLADYGPIWQPRYMGMTWPALAMGVSVLLLRLPTRVLRWGAIVLLLGVNGAQAWARMDINGSGAEPRVDLVAADLVRAQASNGAVRTFVNLNRGGPGPGEAPPWEMVGRYYLSALTGERPTPMELRRTPVEVLFPLVTPSFPAALRTTLQHPPAALRQVIVWEHYAPPATAPRQELRLPPGWTMASESVYPAYLHWTWQPTETWRRRIYIANPLSSKPSIP